MHIEISAGFMNPEPFAAFIFNALLHILLGQFWDVRMVRSELGSLSVVPRREAKISCGRCLEPLDRMKSE